MGNAEGMSGDNLERSGNGLVLFGLVVGAVAASAFYAIGEYWLDGPGLDETTPATLMQTIAIFAAGWVLLAERGDLLKPILPAALIAAVLAGPTYWLLSELAPNDARLTAAPAGFWFALGAPIAAFLLTALAKSYGLGHGGRNYTALFFHGLTLPLIAGGAAVFAGLSLLLLFAWAALLKALGVDAFQKVFQEPWFILPFLGAVGGLSIGLIRAQQAVLGALRFILLLLARLLAPIMAAFSITLLAALAVQGPEAVLQFDYVAGGLLGLAFMGMLIFNGVYQNGEGGAPPIWLRISIIIVILTLPVFVGLSAYAFWLRVSEYGLTPPRIYGLAVTALAVVYTGVLLIGLTSELNWRAKRWMAPIAPLNASLAGLWAAALILLSTPIVNTWAISAKSQEEVFLSGAVPAEDFDFGYLQFSLGAPGAAALDRLLALETHPEAATIRARIEAARTFENYWSYKRYLQGFPTEDAKPSPSRPDSGAPSGPDRGPNTHPIEDFEDDAAHIEDLQDLPLAPAAAK
ncbi:MAG: DUF4153 domain-containing protein [Pseudomonadota bacterium]